MYVLNNPVSAVDPLGLECVWDDGSYDSEGDKETGSVGGCQRAGGTWIELGQNGGWNPNRNDDYGRIVQGIQNGDYDAISAIGLNGTAYITHYDSQGRVSFTVYDGLLTQYAYYPGDHEVVPANQRSWADPDGATAAGLRLWMMEHPGLPLNPDDRALAELADRINYMMSHPLGKDLHQSACVGASIQLWTLGATAGPWLEGGWALGAWGAGTGGGALTMLSGVCD